MNVRFVPKADGCIHIYPIVFNQSQQI